MSNLESDILDLVKTAREIFENPSVDSRRPKGIYLKGQSRIRELIAEIRKDDFLQRIPIALAPPSEKDSSWYYIDADYFLKKYTAKEEVSSIS